MIDGIPNRPLYFYQKDIQVRSMRVLNCPAPETPDMLSYVC